MLIFDSNSFHQVILVRSSSESTMTPYCKHLTGFLNAILAHLHDLCSDTVSPWCSDDHGCEPVRVRGYGGHGCGCGSQYSHPWCSPVWAGDRSVTWSQVTRWLASTHHDATWTAATTHLRGIRIGKAERGGWAVVPILQKGMFPYYYMYIILNLLQEHLEHENHPR